GIARTESTNAEAVGFLAVRLAKLGVEEQLFQKGAVPGSTVEIGEMVFDGEPTLTSAAELITSPRGTDARLDENRPATRNQRREEYHARMDAKAAARAELDAEREAGLWADGEEDRKSTRLNSSHVKISYAVFCLKKKNS